MRGKLIPNQIKRATSIDGIHDSGGRIIPQEPQAIQGPPLTPEELTGPALLAWHAFIEDMDGMGVITHADRAALILLCQAWAEMQESEKHIAQNGTVIKFANGTVGSNPYCKTRDNARVIVMKLLGEFGITPVSRSRIQIAPVEDEDDEFMELR